MLLRRTTFFCVFWVNITFAQVKKTEADKLAYANEMLQAFKHTKDSAKLAEAYYMYGKIEVAHSNFQKSTAWFLKSLAIQEKRGDYSKMGRLYLRLTESDNLQHHYQEGLKNAKTALTFFSRIDSKAGMQAAYRILGGNYTLISSIPQKNRRDNAMFCYRNAEKIAIMRNDSIGLAEIREDINVISPQKGTDSFAYIERALSTSTKLRKQAPIFYYMNQLVNLNIANHQTKKAYALLQEIEQKRKDGIILPDQEALMVLEGTYYKYYEATGDHQQAFEHYKLYRDYNEAMLSADSKGAVSQLNISYETDKKNKELIQQKHEIELKEANLKLQNVFLWLVGSLLVLASVISVVFFKLFQKNKLLSQRNVILLQEQNHRVKNNLQVISSLLSLQSNLLEDKIAKDAVNESQLRIEAMTILHRQLYDKQDALDSINMEVFISELTEIIIQTYGFLNVETIYDIQFKALKADKAVLIGLVINELVSNACKYAFRENNEPILQISLLEETKEIWLKVKDNGKKQILSFAKNIESQKHSFGMKLINMMVLQLNGSLHYDFNNGSEFCLKFKEI